jgi:hypothetical protein
LLRDIILLEPYRNQVPITKINGWNLAILNNGTFPGAGKKCAALTLIR